MRRTQQVIDSAPDGIGEGEDVFRAVCLDAAERLEADLVSVWRFEKDHQLIRCLCALDALTGAFSRDQELRREDFPTYFAAVIEENIVCAPDARTHPVTQELTAAYFAPNGIVSLLDFIVHHDFHPVGIICCESRTQRRDWSESDRAYLRSLAALASFKTRI